MMDMSETYVKMTARERLKAMIRCREEQKRELLKPAYPNFLKAGLIDEQIEAIRCVIEVLSGTGILDFEVLK